MPLDQAIFREALRRGALPPGVTAVDPKEAVRRFAVYRNNVAVSLGQALARRFPVIERLVGTDFFVALSRAYLEADPPQSPVLAEWGAGFPRFLESFAPLARWPYMADVARIEYARGRAFHAADADPIDPALLAGADPARLLLMLHPSVTVLRTAHPAVAIWTQNQPGAPNGPIPAGPQIALILRNPSYAVPVQTITSAEAALIEAICAGATLAEGAATLTGHDLTPCLVALMQQGAIVGARVR